ncbi:MAG: VCBS repeat-containing protein [Bacteroidales bacterium]|nr:VCBS repeat-containing protein [Bacteroidales bacterium]
MKLILSILLSAIFILSSIAQETEDPFNWTEPIIIPNSFYLLWSAGPDDDSMTVNLDVYFNYAEGNSIERLRTDSFNYPIARNGKIVLEVANFDDDGEDDVIAAWESPDSTISLFVLHPNHAMKIPVDGKIIQSSGEQKRIFIQRGDFDGDKLDEFVLAFISEDAKINLMLYDPAGSNEPELVALIRDEDLSGNPANKYRFSPAVGDFDGDGDDDIAILSYDSDNDPAYNKGLYIKIYDFSEGNIIPLIKEVVMPEEQITKNNFSLQEIVLSMTSLRPDPSLPDILAIALTTIHNSSPNDFDTFVQLVKPGNGMGSFTYDTEKIIGKYKNPNFLPPMTLASGDIDGNNSEELVFSLNTVFDVYEADHDLNLTYRTGGNVNGPPQQDDELRYSYDYLDIKNIDAVEGDEVILVKNNYTNDFNDPYDQSFNLRVWGVNNGDLSGFSSKGTLATDETVPWDWPERSFAISSGSYDNSRIVIEAPRYYHTSEIGQPVVILNAPPVHFDQLNGNIYDINSCYLGGLCNFSSTYIKAVTTTEELTTTVQSAWDVSGGIRYEGSVSTGVTIEGAPLGVGVSVSAEYSQNFEFHLLANYGKNFEETSGRKEEVSVEIEVTAIEDDQIFATLTDYDVWEYPYFVGNSAQEAGSIWAFIPVHTEARWFPSKSVSGYAYRPIHEVGNILSYNSYDEVHNNPDVLEYIQPLNVAPTFTLSANSQYSWTVNRNTFTSNSAVTGMSYGVDAGFLGGGLTASSNLRDAHLRTHETRVDTNLNISVSIGGIDRSVGPVEYRITPYAYWSRQGALVIDYSVEPEVDLQGGFTWWQEMYGTSPDPAMILPWRLDPEKGFAINDEAKRQQTKDIQLKPSVISTGDTTIVTATIRNFSLVNTTGAVEVAFYLGDPAEEGILVSDIYGNSRFQTDGMVPARGFRQVRFTWVKPGSSGSNRLYMVIDPDNTMTEIHEDNNTGWISTGGASGTTSLEEVETEPYYNLSLFPNPVNHGATLSYTLPVQDEIIIRIFNLSGELIHTYDEGSKEPGDHHLHIEGNYFLPGIYICSLQGSSGTITRKMAVMMRK